LCKGNASFFSFQIISLECTKLLKSKAKTAKQLFQLQSFFAKRAGFTKKLNFKVLTLPYILSKSYFFNVNTLVNLMHYGESETYNCLKNNRNPDPLRFAFAACFWRDYLERDVQYDVNHVSFFVAFYCGRANGLLLEGGKS
jgi:hypothetical protein